MNGVRRYLAEPLIQFLVIGVVLFAAYTLIGGEPAEEASAETIVVSPGRIAHLTDTFSRTWQRPPTQVELDGLIDAYVKEEIYYREGRKLGLDLDDTVFRRRLQQKMEFLLEPTEDQLTPKDGELQAFLEANAESFELPGKIAFRQIFFDPTRRDDGVADAGAALDALNSGTARPDSIGDATLLPDALELSTDNQIAAAFGVQFLDGLVDLPDGIWSGPIPSTFGLHLVRIDDREPPRTPALEDVLDPVTREWMAHRRQQVIDDRFAAIREAYTVIVEPPAEEQGGQAANSETSEPRP